MKWQVDSDNNLDVVHPIGNDSTLIGYEANGPHLNRTLSDDTRIIVETNEKDPKPIAIITADGASNAKGFRIRITPKYKD